jgi:mannose-6-phosphate isomerase
MRPEPTRIEPIFSPRIWGARSLAPLFPEKSNLAEPLGEAWLTGVDCRVANGPFAGKTLGDAWREMPAEWRGTRLASTANFPLLVKFIFPNDKLSIQVHPDDAYAAAHEQAAGGRGKTEVWHIVSAEPGARVLVGFKPGVNRVKFLEALASQTLEELLEACPVRAGDTIFVPAGTPHTIGPGMVICEVQEYSDLTYRVYDYGRVDAQGRPRELHTKKALEVIQFGASPIIPFQGEIPRDEFGIAHINYLAACRYFAAERWDFSGWSAKESTDPQRFELLVILKGTGKIRWNTGDCAYAAGETWFLPASLGKYELGSSSGQTQLVRVYVPDIAAFAKMIADKGYTEAQRRQFIFA